MDSCQWVAVLAQPVHISGEPRPGRGQAHQNQSYHSRIAKFTQALLLNLEEAVLIARSLPLTLHTPCPPSRLLETFILTWSGGSGGGHWGREASQICEIDFPWPPMNGLGYSVLFYCVRYLFVITLFVFCSVLFLSSKCKPGQ